ncbi:mechanosensitive ion channel family protein [Achromobacter denitrificans]|uniref:mechanosensitive ion channel family protein n=1 Tax=Achromobacter denitrificans TaxID=32002 RepID=UPI0023E81FA1|nr:mechanosensitive ion channel family protein [Achromobacter denitrificans]MDF3849148.1 mechanosensitive ion channel family protein [Achromobacter denitrificans]
MHIDWLSGIPVIPEHPLLLWAFALTAGAVLFFALSAALRIARTRLQRRAEMPGHPLARSLSEVLRRTNSVLLLILSLLIGAEIVGAPLPWSGRNAQHLWFVLVTLQLALWFDRALDVALAHALAARGQASTVTATLFRFLLRTLVAVIALLAMLDNLGVNITALVASLGIGGVAVALAVQTILSDLFASISIGLDKPFEAGDFIVFGQVAGSIEHVGLKTTRIRSLGGEQIVCSNTELLKQTIQNYKRMQQRRIVFTVRITYMTAVDEAAAVPGLIRGQIERQPETRYDRAHLARFGENALEYEAVYYVMTADYNRYMDIQQDINLGVMRELDARGIALALPERVVHVAAPSSREPGSPAPARPGTAFAIPPAP